MTDGALVTPADQELIARLRGVVKAIVIGGSAGSIDALFGFLPALRPGFTLPIVTVVHLPRRVPSRLVEIFGARCALPVKEPEDKEPLAPGTIYFAPPDYHLLIDDRQCFALSVEDPVHFSRPSIDVLFESVATALGPAALCIVLAGANADGARGAAAIQQAGGTVFVQAPQTSQTTAMPQAAIRTASPERVVPPETLGALLTALGAPG